MEVEQSFDNRSLIAYLKVRGLPVDAATLSRAGIEFAGPRRCREALGLKVDAYDKRIGIIFHYPNSTYSTVRWFGKYLGAFGTVIDRKADAPAGVPPEAYLSPLVDWANPSETVYICESALKALVVSSSGRHALAGSGVWGLLPKGTLLVPEFLRETTKKVVIAFDNDWKQNTQVRASIRRLGNLIMERWPGVKVVHGQIPDPPAGSFYHDAERGKSAGRWGIDDAIATLGENVVFAKMVEADIEPTERELALDEFNETYAVCLHPPCIIRIPTGNKYTRNEFTGLLEADRKVWTDDGKPLEVSKLWLAYDGRTKVDAIRYIPGGDRIVDSSEGTFYNEWQDSGPVARVADVSPFLKLYENAICDEGVRNLLFDSFAWMLQNRGTKLEKTFIFVGRQVGTGKSLLARVFGRILGESNYTSIGVEDFAGDFNSAFAAKELVLVDDLHRMQAKEVAKLKRYTTVDKLVVNAKNIKQYEIKNSAVFVITTNEYSSIAMDDMERRNLVVSFEPQKATALSEWAAYVSWLDNDGGYGALRQWFENRALDGFDPAYVPPMTETKALMVSAGRDEIDNWVKDLYEDPDGILGENKRSVYTAAELWFVWQGTRAERGDAIRMGTALINKFPLVNGGKYGKFYGGTQAAVKMFAIRPKARGWDNEQVRLDVARHLAIR